MGTQSSMLSNVDANTIITAGAYQVGDTSTVSNLPSGVSYGQLIVTKARGYIRQEYYELSTQTIYVRSSTNTGSTWSTWTNHEQSFVINKNSPKTISCGGYLGALVVGFINGYGGVVIGLQKSQTTLVQKNLYTGNDFSSSVFTISCTSSSLTFSSTVAGNSSITLIIASS